VDCPACGRQIEDDSVYCRHCGSSVATSQAPLEAAPETRPGVLPSNVETYEAEVAGPLVYAGFWRRFAALIVDTILVTLLSFVVGLLIGAFFAIVTPQTAEENTSNLAGSVGLLMGILYYPLQESSAAQATWGKRLLNIKVTDAQRQRISFWRALARSLGKIVSAMTLGIGYLMAGFTPRKQALHDMLADTLVLVR